jgi:hypothetical protein
MWLEWTYANNTKGLEDPRADDLPEAYRPAPGRPKLLLFLEKIGRGKKGPGRVRMKAYWVEGETPKQAQTSYLGLFFVDMAQAFWSELIPSAQKNKNRVMLGLEGLGFLKKDAERMLEQALKSHLETVKAGLKQDGRVECSPVDLRVVDAGEAEKKKS